MSKLSHYIDFSIIAKEGTHELMAILFSRLHRRLWDLNSDRIGVSFPEYSLNPCTVGNYLRVHGSATDLEELMVASWLRGFTHHLEVSSIREAPATTTFARWARGENAGCAIARRMYRERGEVYRRNLRLPHLYIGSRSSRQARYRFGIRRIESPETGGAFNTFGLSRTATVPIF